VKRLRLILGIASAVTCALPAVAQVPAPDVKSTAIPADSSSTAVQSTGADPGQIVLAMGTPVKLELDRTVKSNGSRSGDPVRFHTSEAVYSTDGSNKLFIDKDATAMGHIIVAKRRGFIGRRGDLQFQIDYVMNVQGKRVYLNATCQGGRAVDRGAIAVTTYILLGAGGLLVQGGDKKYSEGTQFTVYVDQDAKLAQ